MQTYHKQTGFTLIEVMIVVVIIAILVSIAYPSYARYAIQAKRTTAKTELMRVAQLQERFYIDNRTYGALSVIGLTADTYGVDENGNAVAAGAGIYDITATAAIATAFTLQATARNDQLRDVGCTPLTVTDAGVQNPAGCW